MSDYNIDFEKDVVLGCVAENTPKYLSQALRLVQSLRWFGGETAKSTFIVCVVNEIDPTYQKQFEKYGAQVRTSLHTTVNTRTLTNCDSSNCKS